MKIFHFCFQSLLQACNVFIVNFLEQQVASIDGADMVMKSWLLLMNLNQKVIAYRQVDNRHIAPEGHYSFLKMTQ